ncbi:MAG: DinB family protein [Gemmatimonadetes bacterium]|nr:DinB family protein [Gemmatimonadota bacterium]
MRPMRITRAMFLVAVALTARPLHAQKTHVAQLTEDWTRYRDNVIAYVDAMPDSAMSFRPAAGERTFAQQIDHLATTNMVVAAATLKRLEEPPFLPDTARIFHERQALHAWVTRCFDYVLASIQQSKPADWTRELAIFGQPNPQSVSRWMMLAAEHSAFTLGQTAPYLRLSGVKPPGYQLPF